MEGGGGKGVVTCYVGVCWGNMLALESLTLWLRGVPPMVLTFMSMLYRARISFLRALIASGVLGRVHWLCIQRM